MPSRHTPLAEAEAFAELYQRTHLVVFRFIYALTGGPQQEVEDLTADTFIRAWKARHRFEGDQEAALSWLLRIARNLVIDSHRRTKVRGVETNLEDALLITPDASPEEQVGRRAAALFSGRLKQHYRHESFLQKEVKNAIRKSQITKNASCHTFRHSIHMYSIEINSMFEVHLIYEMSD